MRKAICLLVAVIILLLSACNKNEDIAIKDQNNDNYVENEESNKSSEKFFEVDAICDEIFANSNGSIYTTEKYFYIVDNFSVIRYDKNTFSSYKITDGSSQIVAATRDGIYYIEKDSASSKLYRISDGLLEAEYLYSLSNEPYVFANGEYLYSVSQNGTLVRCVNASNKYNNSKEIMYSSDYYPDNVKFYNGYMYLIMSDKKQLECVSLDDNTVKIINLEGEIVERFGTTMTNSSVYFCKDYFTYVDNNSELYIVDLKTSAIKKIEDIKVNSYFVANGKIYANDYDNYYHIDVNSGVVSNYDVSNAGCSMFGYCYSLSDTGEGLIYSKQSNRLILTDYDGNIMAEMVR